MPQPRNLFYKSNHSNCSVSEAIENAASLDSLPCFNNNRRNTQQPEIDGFGAVTRAGTRTSMTTAYLSRASKALVPDYLDTFKSTTIDVKTLRLKPEDNNIMQRVLGEYPISTIWAMYLDKEQEKQFRLEENQRNIHFNRKLSWIFSLASALIAGMLAVAQPKQFDRLWPYVVRM
jgi:hypothetical protein